VSLVRIEARIRVSTSATYREFLIVAVIAELDRVKIVNNLSRSYLPAVATLRATLHFVTICRCVPYRVSHLAVRFN